MEEVLEHSMPGVADVFSQVIKKLSSGQGFLDGGVMDVYPSLLYNIHRLQ